MRMVSGDGMRQILDVSLAVLLQARCEYYYITLIQVDLPSVAPQATHTLLVTYCPMHVPKRPMMHR